MSCPTDSDGQHPVVSHLDANVPASASGVSVTDGIRTAACLLLGYAGTNSDVTMSDINQGVLVSTVDSVHTPLEENVPLDQRVAALISHLEQGGLVPDAQTLVKLLRSLVQVPQMMPQMAVPCATPCQYHLIQEDTGKKFPHWKDTQHNRLTEKEAIWTQCKTKMTEIEVRLCDAQGESVHATTLQERGLDLLVTLHKNDDSGTQLNDNDNPREGEGLFRGRSGGAFTRQVTMLEARHRFRFQVCLLSNDIGGSQMFVKIAPVHPGLAGNNNLIIRSRSFISRARMPDKPDKPRPVANASLLLNAALHVPDN